jgi:glycosyltransferase involved in cell wall biosynthesis
VLPCRAAATDFEGFGIAFLEAMSYGKPVIAGNSGGVAELVHDRDTGLLVTPEDAEAVATALLYLLENPSEASNIAARGQQLVRERYRWDLIAQEYLTQLAGSQ